MFEVVDESLVSVALDGAIRDLLVVCFPADTATFSRTRYWHGSAPVFSVVHRKNGRVLGHVGVVARTILSGENRIAVGGVQNLAVRPETRGTGIAPRLMESAMVEAQRRGLGFGLLFCVPGLKRFYIGLGWVAVDVVARMRDPDSNATTLIPGKNICMTKTLGSHAFPAGEIDLCGPDW
jgi:predicted N-acetyltransferase YhbS